MGREPGGTNTRRPRGADARRAHGTNTRRPRGAASRAVPPTGAGRAPGHSTARGGLRCLAYDRRVPPLRADHAGSEPKALATSGSSLSSPHALPVPTRLRAAVRALAIAYLGVVLLAVLWPAGGDIIEVKEAAGPWFLGPGGKDVVLNVGMLAPLTLLAVLGWPTVPWWSWALWGSLLGAAAELAQWALPVLHRRGWWVNAVENATGAWIGAAVGLVILYLLRRAARRRGGLTQGSDDPAGEGAWSSKADL